MSEGHRSSWPLPDVAVGAAVVLVSLASLVGFAGGVWSAGDLLAHFRLHYGMLTLLTITVALLSKRRGLAALAAIFAAPNTLALAAAWLGPLPDHDTGADLSLVALNLLVSNREFDAARRYIETADADVVVLQEVDAAWLAALALLHDRYPYRWEAPRLGAFGIAVFSRLPATDARTIPLGPRELPALSVTVETTSGAVRVIGVHTVPPIDARHRQEQLQQVDEVAALVRSSAVPTVVAGDFNTTPWGHAYAVLTDGTALRHSGTMGLHPTWPAAFGALGIPLDHALHTPGLIRIQIGDVGMFGGDALHPLHVPRLRRAYRRDPGRPRRH